MNSNQRFGKHSWLGQAVEARMKRYVERVKFGNPIVGTYVPGPGSINLMSNDYLSLGSNTEIIQAMINSLQQSSHAPIMSAVFLHPDSPQSFLERRMAEFSGFEDAMICQSGYAANDGLLQCVADPSKPVYLDKFAHYSFIQGCISAKVEPHIFNHNDVGHLKELIEKHGPGLVLVDSVYSSVGSICPLIEVANLCSGLDCALIVDESHSLGLYGEKGEGIVAALGLHSQVDFVTASLSKAFASRAGIILAAHDFCEFVRYHSSPSIFSSGLLPHDLAGLDKTLDVIMAADDRRSRLFQNSKALRDGLKSLGYNIGYSEAHVISIIAGPEENVVILRDALESRGVFGAVFSPPATPKNATMIRFTVNSELTSEQIQKVLKVCGEAKQEFEQAIKSKK